MNKNIRAFIAIEILERVQHDLSLTQDKLRASGADVAWTAPKNIHLTLKFLGDLDPKHVPAVIEIMTQTVASIPAFSITITELGAFPDILFPKIIWAGVTTNADILARIAKSLEDNLTRLKIKKEERPFAAHITLGRMRSFRNKDKLSAALEETNLPAGLTQQVTKLTLFKSTLTPQGSVYESLATIALK